MGTVAQKITYLGETKSILKDTINMSNANITNSTTFRNYATQLKEGYIDILNNGTDTLYNNFTHLTGKGMTLSFSPTYQAPMKISCYGSTSQASTPTPSSPVDVVNTTGNQSINVCGKNLFDKNNVINAFLNSDGTTTTNSTFRVCDYINVSNYEYITISGNSGSSELVCFYDENKNHINANVGMGSSTSKTITIPNEAVYMRATIKATILDEYQIEVGQSATTYEAYNGTNYNIGLGNIELCKIGDYEDKIDKSTGKNKMPIIDGTVSLNGITITVKDGYVIINGTSTGSTTFKLSNGLESVDASNPTSAWLSENCVSNKNNTTLSLRHISGTGATSGCAFRTYADTTTYLTQFYPAETEQSTTYNTSGEISCLVFFTTGNRTFNNYKFAIQLESGNSVTDYEPYGTDWYLKKNVGKVVLDGSSDESYSVETINDLFRATATYFNNLDILNLHTPYICNRLTYLGLGLQTQEGIANSDVVSANRCFIYLNPSRLTESTLTAFRTWLSNNNLEIYFQLATPTYTKITDSTLIEQLEAIKSKDNTTNITSSMVIGAVALEDLR